MAILGFIPAEGGEEQLFHNIISFHLSATETETTNQKAASETRVGNPEPRKEIQREVNVEDGKGPSLSRSHHGDQEHL